jgi:FkbH-like protein
MTVIENLVDEAPSQRGPTAEKGGAARLKSIQGCLRHHRIPICSSIVDQALEISKYQRFLQEHQGSREDFALKEFQVLVDCLALYYETGDTAFRQIFLGEILKVAHLPRSNAGEQDQLRSRVSSFVSEIILGYARRSLSSDLVDRVASDLECMHRAVTTPTRQLVDILTVGDCFFLEVFSFLAAPFQEQGIALNPHYFGTLNPVALRDGLRERSGQKWAAVCYSPFTYTFASHYNRSLTSGTVIADPRATRLMVEPAAQEIRGHLDLLAAQFDCPIFVHNSSNIRRHNGTLVDRLKIFASHRTRDRVRSAVNRLIADHIEKVNAATFPHVHLFDEHQLLRRFSEWRLGRRFYESTVHHHTVLARHVAEHYRDLLEAQLRLSTKKVVVCDLDNTLWQGEIGEGKIQHYLDRQVVLRCLREKGVLLAINSRNDPRNVHWDGAVLDESDFVASEINWDSKPSNIRRIQQNLNLKTKDFVFIDDRSDQRELVANVYPEIHVMDATLDRSWRLLEHWSRLVSPSDEGDRTQQYRERADREKFLATPAEDGHEGELLAKLGLQATIRPAAKSDLKRIVDLINRTNQFNLNGTRTTFREASHWLAATDHHILLIDGADKFGSMGIICVAFVELVSATVRIPVFVLSCRVFGYGFETAMLGAIHRLAWNGRQSDAPPMLIGLYEETALNEPCRAMYVNHGFIWCDGVWVHQGGTAVSDPVWLTVCDRVSA